jgi:hypothetical protein
LIRWLRLAQGVHYPPETALAELLAADLSELDSQGQHDCPEGHLAGQSPLCDVHKLRQQVPRQLDQG